MPASIHNVQSLLARAAGKALPRTGMCGNLQVASAASQICKTNPPHAAPSHAVGGAREAAEFSARTNPIKARWGAHQSAALFGNVRQCSAPHAIENDETNPTAPGLSPRQVSAARLLVLGRTGRDAARALGVNEHTITRWRRLPAFEAELARQHRLVLALELGERGHSA
jgi:hypothetical protein